jgi:hypothetical protein
MGTFIVATGRFPRCSKHGRLYQIPLLASRVKSGESERNCNTELRQKYCYPGGGRKSGKRIRCAKSRVTLAGMDKTMSKPTRIEVLRKLRRRYGSAGAEHKRKLLDQAQELLGYHRKSAIRALRAPAVMSAVVILSGRPVKYEPELLVPWLRPIWQATDYACGRRLVAMLPE